MKKIIPIIITAILVSGCNFEPALAVAKKNEVITSPIAFLIFMSVLILLFSIKPKKPRKKPNH